MSKDGIRPKGSNDNDILVDGSQNDDVSGSDRALIGSAGTTEPKGGNGTVETSLRRHHSTS